MPHKVIPIQARRAPAAPPTIGSFTAATGPLADSRGRMLRDLRISVTDRCNFRCTYCMPREVFGTDHAFLPQSALLSFEEIERLARVFVGLGVRKIRLTGGEPLLRRELHRLVAALAPLGADLALTTNGSLLAKQARDLRAAGLSRITVSLDALDDATFRRMNDADYPVARVLEAIDVAADAGFSPIKVNMVVRRGVNDAEILPMAERFRGTGHILRFIEYMDVGSSNGWRMDDVVTASEILARIGARHPIEPAEAGYRGEVAKRWRYRDGGGEIGVIASVTQAFCGDCNRLRLSTEGQLFTCLFAESGHDLRALLRTGADDDALRAVIAAIWTSRDDRYSELRGANTPGHAAHPKVEMSYIGG